MQKLFLALLVLAHVLTDFIFQTQKMADQKGRFSTLCKHIIIGLITSLILLSPYLNLQLTILISIICATHFLIDFIKIFFERRWPTHGLELLIADQAFHILIILLCYPLLGDTLPMNRYSQEIGRWILTHYPIFAKITVQQWYIAVIVVTGYLFNLKGGTVFVRRVLEKFNTSRQPHDEDGSVSDSIRKRWNTGSAIGILERLFIVTLVLRRDYAAIGLVLTGKSFVRFQEFKSQEFAEYYLIGTLTSIFTALVTGLILNAVLYAEKFSSIFCHI